MLYLLLADLVMVMHFLFIIFAILGGLLLFVRGYLVFVHLPAFFWAAMISFKGWICPLTLLENDLLRAAGREGYSEGFVGHYLTPIIYPERLTSSTQIMFGILVVVINIGIYAFVCYKRMAKREGI